jgi:hypothetical protein
MGSFSFGSVPGSTFAFYFFLLIALLIGFAIFRLLVEPRLTKVIQQSIPKALALAIAAGFALIVFLGIYFSSLDGFYRMEIGQQVRLDYILPKRTILLNRSEIAEARRVPSYKGCWRLVLYTPSGAQFTSAQADYASTRKAVEYLEAQLNKE